MRGPLSRGHLRNPMMYICGYACYYLVCFCLLSLSLSSRFRLVVRCTFAPCVSFHGLRISVSLQGVASPQRTPPRNPSGNFSDTSSWTFLATFLTPLAEHFSDREDRQATLFSRQFVLVPKINVKRQTTQTSMTNILTANNIQANNEISEFFLRSKVLRSLHDRARVKALRGARG